MKKQFIVIIITALLLAGIGGIYLTQQTSSPNLSLNPTPSPSSTTSSAKSNTNTSLSDTAVRALTAALDDEYKAYTTYTQIIDTYGSIRPFSNVVEAEKNHIAALQALFTTYHLEALENPYTNQNLLQGITSATEACSAGVEAEIANAALYRDTLLPAVAAYPDITATFTELMNASQIKHLPAFERCGGGGAK